MLKRHQYYYLLKPYLPLSLRLFLRRSIAAFKRRYNKAVWPIYEPAGRTPADWPGWPEGKSFALVLTHDVEGPDGLAKCRHLAELELKMGFRSCFNFIPEGSYTVPVALRSWLIDNGFEVGVHDLKHDGKLYASHTQFRRHARRINKYLHEWDAVGFRSGFMHHHQEWLHDLNVSYDASTFDTDPFEPQPDGVNTIFPFWISPNNQSSGFDARSKDISTSPNVSFAPGGRNGYVELPYTLPQDSTLFLLLREKSDDIWRTKLDWIVGRGGMVLVNVHPDYLQLKSKSILNRPSLTAEDHYSSLLRYITEQHQKLMWHALPRDVAEFVRQWKNVPVFNPDNYTH